MGQMLTYLSNPEEYELVRASITKSEETWRNYLSIYDSHPRCCVCKICDQVTKEKEEDDIPDI